MAQKKYIFILKYLEIEMICTALIREKVFQIEDKSNLKAGTAEAAVWGFKINTYIELLGNFKVSFAVQNPPEIFNFIPEIIETY